MTSKEALDVLLGYASFNERYYSHKGEDPYGVIKKDLDRLEMLEKENKVLREKVNHFKNVKNRHKRNQKFVEKENTKLKKAIEILKRQNEGQAISQEEDELLKEVIGNE